MSISGGGGWGASEALGGSRGNDRGSDNRGNRAGQGPNRSDASLSGGSRGNGSSSAGDRGSDGRSSAPGRSLGSLRAELDRRDRAAVAALGGTFGGVNQASLAFNDDEEGWQSIGEALDSFGAWAKDQVGINNPRGFLGSNVAKVGAGALGFLAGGAPGAALASTAVSVASDPKPSRNMIGYAANALGGLPGLGGLAATAVSLADENFVDLDKVVATGPTSTNTLGSYRAPAGNTTTLGNQFPGGRQGGDNPILPANTALASARTGTAQPAKTKPNPNTIRRTFSPLNISYAKLRGIEELL